MIKFVVLRWNLFTFFLSSAVFCLIWPRLIARLVFTKEHDDKAEYIAFVKKYALEDEE